MTPLDPEEKVFSLGDVARLFRKKRAKLILLAFLFAIMAAIYMLSRPARYTVHATFKESAEKKEGDNALLKSMLGNLGSFEAPQAAVLMKSYRVLKPIIIHLGLQAQIQERGWLNCHYHYCLDNIRAELHRPLPNIDSFRFKDVCYEGEKAFSCRIIFRDAQTFDVYYRKKKFSAKLGEPIDLGVASFRLMHAPQSVQFNCLYPLTINSWLDVVQSIRSNLKIVAHKLNQSIDDLSLSQRDRFLGAEILNELMAEYQHYLKQDHDQVAAAQLAYLEERQQSLLDLLNLAMDEHVSYLRSNVQDMGFLSSDQESKAFSVPYQELFRESLSADMEMAQLSAWQKDVPTHLGENFLVGAKIHRIRDSIQELESERELIAASIYFHSPKEGLFHLQNGNFDLEGIDLATAKKLIMESSENLDHSKAEIQHLHELQNRVEDSTFNLSSLSSVLKDPTSEKLLAEATELHLQIEDEDNHSDKEEGHNRRELSLQRKILQDHLQQLVEIEQMNVSLAQEKIASLQQISLDCINRQISVKQEQIEELISQRKESLIHEKQLLEKKMQDLRLKMNDLPDKWRAENILKLKTELGINIMQSVAQLVESKTIGQNLHTIESKPLDLSVVPYLPESPHLILFCLALSFLGGIGGYLWFFFRALIRGFPVAPDTLQALNYPFAGCISSRANESSAEHLTDQDLESLRKIPIQIDVEKSQIIGLFGGKGPDYTNALIDLLARSGLKPLLVYCDFSNKKEPGLLQVLQKECSAIPIVHKDRFDVLMSGGFCRFGTELIRSVAFSQLLQDLKKEYRLILLFSRAPLNSAENESLLSVCDHAIVTVVEEPIELLTPLTRWAYDEGQCRLTILVASDLS